MKRLIPASRAIVLGAVFATAMASTARADDAAPATAAPEAAAPAAPFTPTIYIGPQFGYANAFGDQYGWSVDALARPLRYLGLQLEYFNVGPDPHVAVPPAHSGDFDGLYLGAMPILPIGAGVSLFGQIGGALSSHGYNVAGGGGLLYDVPIEVLNKNRINLLFRVDYKYFNLDPGGEHLLTFGFMLGFHK